MFSTGGLIRVLRLGSIVPRSCVPPKRNYKSSEENPGHTQWYIDEEVSAGRLRPIPDAEGRLAHWSPIGMVPKDHQPGRSRLIIDLSAPMGGSVNEGIDPNLTSLTYHRVEDAVRLVKAAGPGASLI